MYQFRGLPQGSVLRPLLFLHYIDFPYAIQRDSFLIEDDITQCKDKNNLVNKTTEILLRISEYLRNNNINVTVDEHCICKTYCKSFYNKLGKFVYVQIKEIMNFKNFQNPKLI